MLSKVEMKDSLKIHLRREESQRKESSSQRAIKSDESALYRLNCKQKVSKV